MGYISGLLSVISDYWLGPTQRPEYIDTGAFLARHLSKDQYHRQASTFWDSIRKKSETCVTSNFVLDETFTLISRRAGYSFAAQRARNIYASESLKILRPSLEDELKAIGFFEKYSDHRLSFTDCVSFVLMKSKKIKRVFTVSSQKIGGL